MYDSFCFWNGCYFWEILHYFAQYFLILHRMYARAFNPQKYAFKTPRVNAYCLGHVHPLTHAQPQNGRQPSFCFFVKSLIVCNAKSEEEVYLIVRILDFGTVLSSSELPFQLGLAPHCLSSTRYPTFECSQKGSDGAPLEGTCMKLHKRLCAQMRKPTKQTVPIQQRPT